MIEARPGLARRRAWGVSVVAMGGVAALLTLLTVGACSSILGAEFDRPPAGGDGGGGSDDGSGGGGGSEDGGGAGGAARDANANAGGGVAMPSRDGGASNDGSATHPADGGTDSGSSYASAQAALAGKRILGPVTTEGSTGYCTDHHFVWKETNGALHSWSAVDHSSIDYSFTQGLTSFFSPGETYIPVLDSSSKIDVYRTASASSLVSSLSYVYATAGTDDGAVLVALVDGDLKTKQLQHWSAADGGIVDVGSSIPSAEPPTSFGRNEMILPGSSSVPYPIYIANVLTGDVATVEFDGALALDGTVSSQDGLLVWYVKTGPTPELRLYKNNDTNVQIELGAEIASTPGLYPDSPAMEHAFVARIAAAGDAVIFGSAYGIFAYGMLDGTLSALQLAQDMKVGVPDILCVIPDDDVLMYRIIGDTTLQAWALPLTGLLP